MAIAETPLCGDVDCECPGCQPQAIRDWYDRQKYEAKKLVRPWAVTPEEERRFG